MSTPTTLAWFGRRTVRRDEPYVCMHTAKPSGRLVQNNSTRPTSVCWFKYVSITPEVYDTSSPVMPSIAAQAGEVQCMLRTAISSLKHAVENFSGMKNPGPFACSACFGKREV